MHELIVQICFVVAGVVTGCTDGHVRTDDPYLTSRDVSPVYVYDAPQCVSNHYHTSHTPSIRVGPIRLSWPTYTRHHKAHPWCTNTRSHYHGSRWFQWRTKYKHHRHHNHNAHHGHHHKKPKVVIKKKRPSKVIVHRSGPSKVVIKPKKKYSHHHKKNKKVVVTPKRNYKKGSTTMYRRKHSGPAKVLIKPRTVPNRNWRRQPRPKVNIPDNMYRPNPKKKGNKKGKKGKKKGKKKNKQN